jgi:hypothetical protein
MPCSPLPRPQRRKFLPIADHVLRLKREALAKLRKARDGTYRPEPQCCGQRDQCTLGCTKLRTKETTI